MKTHTNFILSPITNILEDSIDACTGIGIGIETYPLCEYIMQSTFLKMTGYQEQKMKCICWEIATHDYDYRRTLLGNEERLGECSTIIAKNNIYKQLTKKTGLLTENERRNILCEMFNFIKGSFANTNLSIWAEQDFNWFVKNSGNIIKISHFGKDCLLESCLKYNLLYDHRNRCAHNAQSYQQNLPTLQTLTNKDYVYENYFLRFALLIIIDKIFINLYRKYLINLNENV